MNFQELGQTLHQLKSEHGFNIGIESFSDEILDVIIVRETAAGRYVTETPFTTAFLDDVDATTFKELCEVHAEIRDQETWLKG